MNEMLTYAIMLGLAIEASLHFIIMLV